MAGLEKWGNPAWTGSNAGAVIIGFVQGALAKTGGDHPEVQPFYVAFLQIFVLPFAAFWAWLVTLGEIAVGVGLVLGCLTGIAAFFGGPSTIARNLRPVLDDAFQHGLGLLA